MRYVQLEKASGGEGGGDDFLRYFRGKVTC